MSDSQGHGRGPGNGRDARGNGTLDGGWSIESGRAGRAREVMSDPDGARSSVGSNTTAGEIRGGLQARPDLPPPARSSLPAPPRAWAPPRGTVPGPAPAHPPGSEGASSPVPRVAPGPGPGPGPRSAPAVVPAPVPAAAVEEAATEPHLQPDARDTVLGLGPAVRPGTSGRESSADDFAQESPLVTDLGADASGPVVMRDAEVEAEGGGRRRRSSVNDATVLMDRPGADMTQLIRDRDIDLPRRHGLRGDVRYVFTVLFGVAETRRQLKTLEAKLEVEREAREGLVRVMARELVSDPDAGAEAVREARVRLGEIEEARARHAAEAVSATAELAALDEDRQVERMGIDVEVVRIEEAITALDRELAPLEQAAGKHRKRRHELEATARQLEARIARLEQRAAAASGEAAGKLATELATARAEREAALQGVPVIDGEIRELEPRIEALQARQAEREAELAAAQAREQAMEQQSAARLAETEARKVAAERALEASEHEVRAVLGALGERLWLERSQGQDTGLARSPQAASRIAAIDRCDSAIAGLERQILEHNQRLRRIDRGALIRGSAVLAGMIAAVSALVWLALQL